jgi:glyoxylase-like metal-dependent hydrolase (beta-lactamase superfamily II)
MTTPMASPLVVRARALGPYQTNAYIVAPEDKSDAWVIDAPFDSEDLIDVLRAEGLTPTRVLLTHAHPDHIAGIPALKKAFPAVKVSVHEAEREWLGDPELNLSAFMGEPISLAPADELLRDGDELTLAGHVFRVLHTPGHSPGGVTFLCAALNLAFVGDTLFAGSIGRTDFPGADHATLLRSVRERLYTLPDATKVLPGHGPRTTIAREKMSNPFVRG